MSKKEAERVIPEFSEKDRELALAKLTPRQQEIIDIISTYTIREGISPSLREIGRDAGIASLNGVASHLNALMRKGWIRQSGRSRSRGYILSAAAMEVIPGTERSVNHKTLKQLDGLVREFPDNIMVDLSACSTPLEGALLVINLVDDILAGDY
jgi:hypothetical protein